MSAVYYRLTMPDSEVSGTPAAIREMVRLYLADGGTRFYITGPFEYVPQYRSPDQRRTPRAADRLCARCFHPSGRHSGLGAGHHPSAVELAELDATTCGDCSACRTGGCTWAWDGPQHVHHVCGGGACHEGSHACRDCGAVYQ